MQTAWDIASYWNSDQFAPATWDLGSTLIGLGLCAREAIPLAFAGFLAVGIVLSLNGRIGSTLHTAFPVCARASFGMYGAYAPILVRSILALLWLVILTYQGGLVTAVMIGAIWPSFLKVKNTLPEGLGIDTQEMIGFFVLFVFQAPLACIPVHKLKWFFSVKAYITSAGFLALFIWSLTVTKGKGDILQGSFVEADLPRGSKVWACLAGLNAVTGLYSTVSINIPDFARFAKKPKSSWMQALAVPITGTIPIAIAIMCGQAAQTKYGVAVYDPASLCKLFGSRAAQFFSAFVFWVATIGVNISANQISFATDISSLMPRYLTIFRCSILASLLCWATCPWRLVVSAPTFYNFLSAYPVFLAPVATILATDYYLIRSGKIDVRELYNPSGIYSYTFGINWRAFAAWICALAPNLPSFAHAINAANPNPQPYTYFFSWYFSTFASFIFYMTFSKLFPPRASFVDEAVTELSSVTEHEVDYSSHGASSTEPEKDPDYKTTVV